MPPRASGRGAAARAPLGNSGGLKPSLQGFRCPVLTILSLSRIYVFSLPPVHQIPFCPTSFFSFSTSPVMIWRIPDNPSVLETFNTLRS